MLKVRLSKAPGVRVSIVSKQHNRVGIPPVVYVESGGYEKYTGSYTATPNVEPITLPTKDKVMTDDVTVFKIPLWEVSNPFGGNTIYIGGEEVYGN